MILATLAFTAAVVCPAPKFVNFPEQPPKEFAQMVHDGCARNYPTSPCATIVEQLPSGHVNVTCSEKPKK